MSKMSCFFCESNFHLSQSCNIHVTNKSREKRITLKKCCALCLTVKDDDHTSYLCNSQKKCFICFKQYHNTVLCPERLKMLNFFIPNIDTDLFPRFLQMFDTIEQYSMAFGSPEMFAANKTIRSLKIIEKLKISGDNWDNNMKKLKPIFSFIVKKENVIIRCLELKDTHMHCDNFRHLLSYNIRMLKCSDVWFSSKIPFTEIFKMAPNITSLELDSVNVEITNDWPENLLKHKNGNNMKHLNIKVKNLDFCVRSLAEFMKKQSAINVYITHDQSSDLFKKFNVCKYRESIVEKLSEHFIPADLKTQEEKANSSLRIITETKNSVCRYHAIGNFTLKT